MLFCQSNSLVYHMCIRIWLLRTFSSMCKQRHYWFCHYNSLGIYRYGYLVALRIVFVVKRCHRRSGFCTDIIINLEWTHFRIKLQHRLVVILPNLSFLLALDCNWFHESAVCVVSCFLVPIGCIFVFDFPIQFLGCSSIVDIAMFTFNCSVRICICLSRISYLHYTHIPIASVCPFYSRAYYPTIITIV